MARIKYKPIPPLTPAEIERFWCYVDRYKLSPGGCWEWTKAVGIKQNYGRFSLRHRFIYPAHRIAYFLSNNVDPLELLICHRCDNPRCCNPAHLWLGTHAENSMDMKKKGRSASGDKHTTRLHPERIARGTRHGAHIHPEKWRRGEAHGDAQLTEKQVIEIIERLHKGERSRTIALHFGVDTQIIWRIRRGDTWKHVPRPSPQ